jgi:8-oxo-dGTP pyrophosphatase MutT (NUDIX family)
MTTPPAIPAATVVLMRREVQGPPSLLLMTRGHDMVFAAGAAVFPGGRVDEADRQLAQDRDLAPSALDIDEAAARIAAIRETIEEVGVLAGVIGPTSQPLAVRMREALAEGAYFGELLRDAGLTLDLRALTPFARWMPPPRAEKRSYDTRFYLAAAPEGAKASADGGESLHTHWLSAAEALALSDAGTLRVIFPTRCNLDRLATYQTLEEAVADSGRYPIETITPWVEARDGVDHLCIPEGLGYPITSQALHLAQRG